MSKSMAEKGRQMKKEKEKEGREETGAHPSLRRQFGRGRSE